MALGNQLVLVYGGLKTVARHPGGVHGNWLESCGPSKTWYFDSWGWVRDVQSIFNVSCACLINLYHSNDGNFHHMC